MVSIQELLINLVNDLKTFNYVTVVNERRVSTQFIKWLDPAQEISIVLYHAPRGIYIGITFYYLLIFITEYA